jgi:hypothetical protein
MINTINTSYKTKVQDVLDIIFPSEEFAEDALLVLRGCISEITNYHEETIDMTAFDNQVDLMECNAVKQAREYRENINAKVLQYLQEQ